MDFAACSVADGCVIIREAQNVQSLGMRRNLGANDMELLVFVGISAVSSGCLGAWIAGQKQRDPSEGFFLGLFFPMLGCLIEALLPDRNRRYGTSRRPSDTDPTNERWTAPSPFATDERTSRRISDLVTETIPGDMPEGWGKPGNHKPVQKASDDGVDLDWLKD